MVNASLVQEIDGKQEKDDRKGSLIPGDQC